MQCQVRIDTSKLMADNVYERSLILQTNALPESYGVKVKIKTAAAPIAVKNPPYLSKTYLKNLTTETLIDSFLEAVSY